MGGQTRAFAWASLREAARAVTRRGGNGWTLAAGERRGAADTTLDLQVDNENAPPRARDEKAMEIVNQHVDIGGRAGIVMTCDSFLRRSRAS
jgi:hypothetical protein